MVSALLYFINQKYLQKKMVHMPLKRELFNYNTNHSLDVTYFLEY